MRFNPDDYGPISIDDEGLSGNYGIFQSVASLLDRPQKNITNDVVCTGHACLKLKNASNVKIIPSSECASFKHSVSQFGYNPLLSPRGIPNYIAALYNFDSVIHHQA